MEYKDLFTDFEKMLERGMLEGFVSSKYQTLYEYLYKRKGVDFANAWMLQDKEEKKRYCANLIKEYMPSNTQLISKCDKFLQKYDKKHSKKR